MGLWSSLFGSSTPRAAAEVTSSEQVQRLFERAFGNDPENNSCDARRKAATTLVLANETVKGRDAWLSISRDYPDELAFALEQVGVSYHLEKNYRAAIENYEAAIRVGADAGRLDAAIAEARKGMAAFG